MAELKVGDHIVYTPNEGISGYGDKGVIVGPHAEGSRWWIKWSDGDTLHAHEEDLTLDAYHSVAIQPELEAAMIVSLRALGYTVTKDMK